MLSVVGNNLKGPSISLVLSYSPFTTEDVFGFGKGISITGISLYNASEARLILRDGSNWSVDPHGRMNSRRALDCEFKAAEKKS
nr:hypothetical protein [Elizabethkingia sp. ASV34]